MSEDIRLTDGSILEIKINFLTVYLLQKRNIEALMKKAERHKDKDKYNIDIAANILYCIIRSAGKKVDFDEALMLTPIDGDAIEKIINDFKVQFEKYKKKQTHKM